MIIKEDKQVKIGDILEIPIRRWVHGGDVGIHEKSICKVVDVSPHHITVLAPYGANTSVSNLELIQYGVYSKHDIVGNTLGYEL